MLVAGSSMANVLFELRHLTVMLGRDSIYKPPKMDVSNPIKVYLNPIPANSIFIVSPLIVIMGSQCVRSQDDDQTSSRHAIAKDYQEFKDSFSGEGCKRTVAWKATILRSELERKREEYWRTRNVGCQHVWLTIKQAVEADHETAALLLTMAEIRMREGSILCCIDSRGNVYEVPVFVINDPLAYGPAVAVPSPQKQEIVKEELFVKLRRMSVESDIEVAVNSMATVRKLKEKYSAAEGCRPEILRLFFGGKELEDARTVGSYYIKNKMVVHVCIKG